MRSLRWAVLAAAAVLIGWQLFVPPIIGLADQGDYPRMIGRFGYGAANKAHPDNIAFVPRKFVPDASARLRDYEHIESEYLFVGSAVVLNKVLLNKLISRDGSLDIEMIGLVHAIAFLFAFWRLLHVTSGLRGAPFLWIAALLMFTDVGYVAYWNSFYAEPGSCIFFLFLAGETIAIVHSKSISTPAVFRWSILAALFAGAKSSNFPLALLLAPLGLHFGFSSKLRAAKFAGVAGAALITATAIFNGATVPKPLTMANSYDALFLAILPESKTPTADLAWFGLGPEWVRYSGTGAWSPGTAFGELAHRITPREVAQFWLTHPKRIWRRAKTVLPIAFSLRPEWCGNFERAAGFPPGARTASFTLWSRFHERILTPIGKFLVILLLMSPFLAVFAWIQAPRNRLLIETMGALSTCCLMAFLVAICGDAWDNVKHLFLFDLLFDSTLIATITSIISMVCGRQSHRKGIAGPVRT